MKNTEKGKNTGQRSGTEQTKQKSNTTGEMGVNKDRCKEPHTPRNYQRDDHDLWNKRTEW